VKHGGRFPPPKLHHFTLGDAEGQTARLQLPRDIKSAEVKRISAFMATLAVDYEAV